MDIQTLQNFGFQFVAGQIDYQGRNYGFLTPDGPVLTPDAEQVLLALASKVADRMADPEPAPKKGLRAAPKVTPTPAPAPVAAESPMADLDLD